MGKLYKRVGQPAKKECDNCNTVWDDHQLDNNQHQYGVVCCPCCHAYWEATETIKLPSLKMRTPAQMEIFIPEPEEIRLRSGQMDWDVAYANLRSYRDKR